MVLDLTIYSCLALVTIMTLLSIEAAVRRIERKLNRLELQTGLILDHLQIEIPSKLSDPVKAIAIDPQKKIAAIKLYRQETGASLAEAKKTIEAFIAENRPADRAG